MTRMLLLPALLWLASWPAAAAPARSQDAKAPFSSFAAIDKRLSDVQQQLRALAASLQADEKELTRTHAWKAPAKKLRADTRYVERTAHRLRLYYRRSPWGRRAFFALEKKAQHMGRTADALVRAQTATAARQAQHRLAVGILPLIVQFQAVTTNYGTLHCKAGQTACCEPKKREAAEKIPEHECKWICVESRKACTNGIIGPKSQ